MTDSLSRPFGPLALASGNTTFFTPTAGHTYTLKHINIENPTNGSINIKLGINGMNDWNLFMRQIALGSGESAEFDGILVLFATDTFQAFASVSGLVITSSGLDQF